jgi:hypothetical protein
MLWRHLRWEVTRCELCENIQALIDATVDSLKRCNAAPTRVRRVVGANAAQLI